MSSETRKDYISNTLDFSLPSRPLINSHTPPPSTYRPVAGLPPRPTFALPARPRTAHSPRPVSAGRSRPHQQSFSPPPPISSTSHRKRKSWDRRAGGEKRIERSLSPAESKFSNHRDYRYPSPVPFASRRDSSRFGPERSAPRSRSRSIDYERPSSLARSRSPQYRYQSARPRGRSVSHSTLAFPSPLPRPSSPNTERPSDQPKERSLKERLGGYFGKPTDSAKSHSASAKSLKRALSPSATAEQPAKLPALRSLPALSTGPRTAHIPTGPRALHTQPEDQAQASSSAPTGPRSLQPLTLLPPSPPSLHTLHPTPTQLKSAHSANSTQIDLEIAESKKMSTWRRGKRGQAKGAKGAKSAGPVPMSRRPLSPPLYDLEYIYNAYGNGVTLKPQWAENPKSPLANFLQQGKKTVIDPMSYYSAMEGMVAGQKVFRVYVTPTDGIIGIGDSPNKKESEKLAAMSAVFQLVSRGLLEKGTQGAVQQSSSQSKEKEVTSDETATLSDGSSISYDRARQFMEYYCHRYRFRKPDIEYSQSAVKGNKGKNAMVWDAVMAVNDRRIGIGSANSKRNAQVQCYLDVTRYLENCDPDLWKDFIEYSKKDKSLNLGLAPHLVFQMSDGIIDDIQGLCGDIRYSQLSKNAPPSGVAGNEAQPLPRWHAGAQSIPTEQELADRSYMLQQRLEYYETDPSMARMRQTRASLPVYTRAPEMLAEIEANDVTIIMAATGSGKTTQVPQLLFDAMIKKGRGAECNIVCTQPRRLAAMSVAERIAEERGQGIADEIGYQVRFDAKLPQPNGSITFCTTGIYLKRMQSALGETADPAAVARMDEVSHIVVDEVHERDIDTDLLLVVLKRLLADRQKRGIPLKVILMSATIDPTLFQSYFADSRKRLAPVAEIPGRTFPVERFYLDDIIPQLQGLPPARGGWVYQEKNVKEYLSKELSKLPANFGKNTGMELEIPYAMVALIVALVMSRSEDGHVLVFLPGWDEIKKVSEILMDNRKRPLLGMNFNDPSRYKIHYLHSTIPAAEQKEVFRPPPRGVRRIILATNIAETSITIPDVVYVVDTGRVKEKRYDPERHMSSLVSAWVGSSNLNQRAGRAGRHREGEYYGLVSKNRLESLDPHQMVEMKRSDLSNVVMHVKALNLGEVETVLAATIEPPEPNRIVAAMEVLRMLGALDARQNLTSLGRVLLQLPVEAAIGKLCLYGSFFRCLDSALTLAAVLTNRDPFLAPPAQKGLADQIKDSWSPKSFRSDPLAIVAAYNQWNELDDRHAFRESTMFCDKNFLSKATLLQIKQVKQSLLQSLDQAGVIAVSAGGSVGRIGKFGSVPPALNENSGSLPMLAALIATASAPNFAIKSSEKTCRTWQDKVVFIHGSSVNSRRRETGGPEGASASFNPAEKRLYAFGEKSRNVPLGGNPNSAQTNLRTVTRLDPMTYMLFGAYELVVTQRGLECDGWLPVFGNLLALDDVQRLKSLLDACLLRVFEGLGKSLVMGRDQRWREGTWGAQNGEGESKTKEGDGEEENESDDEEYGKERSEKSKARYSGPLTMDEIRELEMLTTDIVRVLDAYAAEREGSGVDITRPNTRPNTRPASPNPLAKRTQPVAAAKPGSGASWGDANQGWGSMGGAAPGSGGWGGQPSGASGYDDGWGDSGWGSGSAYRPPQAR